MADVAGRDLSLRSVLSGEIASAAAGRGMTDSAVAERLRSALVLDRLVIVGSTVRRSHCVGAAMAPSAIDPAVAGLVAVEHRARIHAGDAEVAGNALRFVHPGHTAARRDRPAHLGKAAVACDAAAI